VAADDVVERVDEEDETDQADEAGDFRYGSMRAPAAASRRPAARPARPRRHHPHRTRRRDATPRDRVGTPAVGTDMTNTLTGDGNATVFTPTDPRHRPSRGPWVHRTFVNGRLAASRPQ
jgi:hypothetical protein